MISLFQICARLKLKLLGGNKPGIETFLHEALRAEADRDLARRSIAGIFSYFLPWLIIYYASGLGQANNTLLEFLGFMLAAASVGRLYLALNFNKLYANRPQTWRCLFAIEAIMSAAVWSGVCVLALNDNEMGPISVMVMLSTAIIAAGGIVSLAPAARLGGIFVVLLFLPIIPFMLLSGEESKRGIALLFMTFFVLMFLMWHRLHAEYWRALSGRAELLRAKEAAEQATIAKGLFIANVSHELRTPLTAVIGALGMVNSYMADSIPAQAKTLIDMAYQNGKRLSILINDILDFEKLNANRMEFHYQLLPLTPFLAHALELNHTYAESYHVSFILEKPVSEAKVIVDENRLMQVMTNLLSNAAKFSPAGGKVLISIKHKAGRVRIAVTDHGEGVPEAFREHIFEKFAQAESSTPRKMHGTGLGLAISKAIIEQMGGVIGFDSEFGQGATFYFELPLAESSQLLQVRSAI